MSNDESTKARSTSRVHRAQPAIAQGPSDRSPEPDLGLPDGQDVDAIHHATKVCVLCDYEEFTGTRQEFDQHLHTAHARGWNSNRVPQFDPCVSHCRWLCSVCGAEAWFPAAPDKHGGPVRRSFDRRFGFHNCRYGKYPNHKRAIGKIDGMAGPVVFYHEGMTFSPEQEQDDPTLIPFLPKTKTKEPKVERKPQARTARARRVG